MTAELEERVRNAFGDLTPSEETDREVLDEITRTVQVAPRHWRWEFAVAAAAAVLAAVLLLIPSDPEPGPEETAAPDPKKPSPLASVTTEDGRFRLDITYLEVSPPEPGSTANPTVKVQGRVVAEGPRVIVGPRLSVLRLTTPDGLDRTPEGFGYQASPDARGGHFALHGIDAGPVPDRIGLLEIETITFRLRDEDHRFEGIGPDADLHRLVSPYDIRITTDSTRVTISAAMSDESIRGAKGKLLDVLPGNRAVAYSARVVDADGDVLEPGIGMGGGGFASVSFKHDPIGQPFGYRKAIAFPVTITIPDPRPVEITWPVFRIRDLSLPRVRDRLASSSPWGEPSAGLGMQVALPTRVEQGERIAATISFRREESGLPAGVTRLETRLAEDSLTLRLTREGGGEEIVVRPDDPTLGMPDPPEPGAPPPNLDRDVPSVRALFPLAQAEVPPGRYRGVVRFEFPPREERRAFFETEEGRLWQGTLTSVAFSLEIVPEPPRTQTIQVPTRLRLVKGLGLSYRAEDSEPVTVPRRNGYILGTRVGLGTEEDDARFEVLMSGPPKPGDANPLYVLPAEHRSPLEEKLTIVVFHTVDQPEHHWNPFFGFEGVLWKRTFDLSFTAEELDALR